MLRNKLTKLYLQAEKEETGKENPDFERLEDIGRGALRRIVVEGDTQMGINDGWSNRWFNFKRTKLF